MTSPESASSGWLSGLRVYIGVIAVANLIWEAAQLPFYKIWRTGTLREQAFAVVHCTLGDILIAQSSLMLALFLVGNDGWPRRGLWPVVALTIIFGVAYTAFSEWLNVVMRASWAYSEWMPVIPLFGFKVGLSPLLQWIIVPGTAFAVSKWAATR